CPTAGSTCPSGTRASVGEERALRRARQPFYLQLAPQRSAAVERRFRIDELHGQPLPRVLRAVAVVVCRDASRQVFRDARIERAIGAADDVDVPANAALRASEAGSRGPTRTTACRCT